MFTVDKIIENTVTLEDRNNNIIFDIEKDNLPPNIKEGDILELIKDKYIINKNLTKKTKVDIRNKFNSLIK